MSVVKSPCKGGGCNRRRRRKSGQVSGELYQLVQGKTVLFEQQIPADGAALSKAQNFVKTAGMAELPKKAVEYIVRLVPVLGPPDDLYRIVLRPDGVILTYPVGAMKK